MDKALEDKIYKKCPIIFRAKDAGIDKNLMGFGFSCDNGWFQIIEELSIEIEAIAQSLKDRGLEEKYLPIVSQVKEKFGTLRYYMHNSTDEMEELIHQAAKKSAITCESCGKRGRLRASGYMLILCDECHARSNSRSRDKS